MSDYFEEPDSQETQHLFGEILATLKVSELKSCFLTGWQMSRPLLVCPVRPYERLWMFDEFR